MLSTRRIAAVLLAGAWALAPGSQVLAQTETTQAAAVEIARPTFMARQFDEALVAYERNHWPLAFSALAQLGNRGHADAARMALQMRRFGPQLYGMQFVATQAQVEHWSRVQACSSDPARATCQVAMQTP